MFLTLHLPIINFGVITTEVFFLCAPSIPKFLESTCVFSSPSPLPHPHPHSLRTEYRIGSSEEERKISPEYHLQNPRELTKETMVCVTQDPDLMTHSLNRLEFSSMPWNCLRSENFPWDFPKAFTCSPQASNNFYFSLPLKPVPLSS